MGENDVIVSGSLHFSSGDACPEGNMNQSLGSLGIILLIVLILGMFIDWIGIVFLVVPIATPIGAALGFDPVWFAMMIILDLHAAYITLRSQRLFSFLRE